MPIDHDAVAREFAYQLLKERRKHGKTAAPATLFREYRRALNKVAYHHGIEGKFIVGCYRIALVTDDKVYKFQYNENDSSDIIQENDFIQEMRESEYSRHFPDTKIVRALSFPTMVQEKVNMDHVGVGKTIHYQVRLLANRLGIEDCHSGNYGWKGDRVVSADYPVFVDVDFRSDSERRKKPRKPPRRSWFV